MRHLLTVLLILLSLTTFISCRECPPRYGADEPTKEYVLYIHNKERGTRGLDQMVFDDDLNKLAQEHAVWMTKFGMIHSRGGGTKFNTWGENIAMGYDTEEKVMDGWMHSSGHKRNILTKGFTHAGVGIARTNSGTLYWCVQFGGGGQ